MTEIFDNLMAADSVAMFAPDLCSKRGWLTEIVEP